MAGSVPALLAFKQYLPFSQGLHGLSSNREAPDFELTDAQGQTVRFSEIPGYRYLFFGFSTCTTICPSMWRELLLLQQEFDQASAPKIVFISADGSPAELSKRFQGFGPNFIALTGSKKAVQDIASDYHILIPRELAEGSHHSATLYLVRPDGRIGLIYLTPPNTETLLSDFQRVQ